MRTRLPCLLTAVWVALAPAAMAQGTELSLRDAVTQAIQRAPALAASRAGIAAAEARRGEIQSGMRPQVSLGTTLLHYGLWGPGTGGLPPGAFGSNLATVVNPSAVSPNSLQLQFSGSQLLYDGNRTADALQMAEDGVRLADLQHRHAKQSVEYQAATAYLNLARAELLLETARSAVEQATEHVALFEARQKRGVGTRLDTLQAQSSLASMQDRYLQARDERDTARSALEAMLGRSLLGVTIDKAVSLAGVDTRHLVLEPTLEGHALVQQNQISHRIQERTSALHARDHLPTLTAIANVASQPSGGANYYYLGGTISWTLLDGGRVASRVDQASAEALKALAELEAARIRVALDIQTAQQAHQTAIERLEVVQQGMQAALEGLELAKIRAKAGVGTALEVTSFLGAYAQAHSAYIQAQHGLEASKLALGQAMGLSLQAMLESSDTLVLRKADRQAVP